MTDDRENDDAADWLSAQFGSDDAKGADDASAADDNTDAAKPDKSAAVDSGAERPKSETGTAGSDAGNGDSVAPVWSPIAAPAPTTPAPAAPASGGFNWGLSPRGAGTLPESAPPVKPESPTEPAPPISPEPLTAPSPPASTGPFQAPPVAPPLASTTPTSQPPHVPPSFAPPPLVTPPPTVPVVPPVVPSVPPPASQPPVSSYADSPFAPQTPPQPPKAGAEQVPAPELPAAPEHPTARHWPFARRAGSSEAAETGETAESAATSSAAFGAPTEHPEPEPFDGSLAGTLSIDAEPRTMALPWESAGTELFTPAAAGGSVAEPATELLNGFETVPADAVAGSSIDALFGDTQFRDYEAEPATSQNPFARSTEPASAGAGAVARKRQPREPLPRSQKILLWIAGALAALLILIGLFYLGTRLPNAGAAAPLPSPSATATRTPTPTPTALAVGPVAPGTYKWDRLLGGECLAPYDSPWAEKFTVVDCASPHPAQMVARGTFAEPAAAATDATAPATPAAGKQTPGKSASAYPGAAALQTQINLLCSAPTVINFAAAGAYSDIQFTASYPATDKQWADGDRSYYCFVTRSSGDALTGSVAVVPAP